MVMIFDDRFEVLFKFFFLEPVNVFEFEFVVQSFFEPASQRISRTVCILERQFAFL